MAPKNALGTCAGGADQLVLKRCVAGGVGTTCLVGCDNLWLMWRCGAVIQMGKVKQLELSHQAKAHCLVSLVDSNVQRLTSATTLMHGGTWCVHQPANLMQRHRVNTIALVSSHPNVGSHLTCQRSVQRCPSYGQPHGHLIHQRHA